MREKLTPRANFEQIARQDAMSMKILRVIESSKPITIESLVTNVLDSEELADGKTTTRIGFARLFSAGLVTVKDYVKPFDDSDDLDDYLITTLKCVIPTELGMTVLEELSADKKTEESIIF